MVVSARNESMGGGQVREWSDVREEARRTGIRNHVGMVFGICVETGSELPMGDPSRKLKGRCVFRGNAVRDEDHYAAVFQGLGIIASKHVGGQNR